MRIIKDVWIENNYIIFRKRLKSENMLENIMHNKNSSILGQHFRKRCFHAMLYA
jgi:hypothetical protein